MKSPDPENRRGRLGFTLVALVAMVALYVLSIGPAEWLFGRNYFGPAAEEWVRTDYAPIL